MPGQCRASGDRLSGAAAKSDRAWPPAALALTACDGGTAKPAAGGSSRTASASATAASTQPYADKTPAEIQLLASEETRTATFKKARGTVTGEGTTAAFMLTYPGSNGGTATDYIAAQGRPYLLKRTETGPEPYEVTYYDFETVTQLRAPADSEVVSLD
ncbi:hypothetical protein AB0F11_35025 [Streptomyces sp. NPDC032472]|uniref:hypothetical protein n=1 Tax=Streptomyces sp. NPDC032472 TaxID=3155018 RepID=UPI0033D2C3C7